MNAKHAPRQRLGHARQDAKLSGIQIFLARLKSSARLHSPQPDDKLCTLTLSQHIAPAAKGRILSRQIGEIIL